MSSTTPPGSVTDVLRLANRTHAAAGEAGLPDLQELLSEQAGRWNEDVLTVVVAGAQKRGKSRLLNAMIGRPDLLPVDVDVATHTRIWIEHGDELSATVERRDPEGRVTEVVIDPSELTDHASVLGDPARRAGVTGVGLRVPEPALNGIRLVDTPGVDSLTLGHRHATVSTLHRADGLLLAVSSQDQPILRHELEFLAEAAHRVNSIAFVLTKVDDSGNWRDLLTENRQRLTAFVDRAGEDGVLDTEACDRLRAAPWIPVSAKLAEAATELERAGRTERAAARRERSGMPALVELLHGWAERRQQVRAGAVLTVVQTVLARLTDVARDEVAAGSDDSRSVDERRAEIDGDLARLNALRRERRRRGIDQQFLGQEASRRVRVRLEEYRRGYEREITALRSPKEITRYAEQLHAALERTLTAAWEEIAADTRDLATTSLAEYLRGLGVPEVEFDTDALVRRHGAADRIRPADGPLGKALDPLADGLPAAMMATSIGLASSHLFGAGAVAAIGAMAFAAPVAIGLSVAGVFLVHKRRLADATRNRSALVKSVSDVFATAAGEMALTAQQAVAAWRNAVEQAADDSLDAQRAELEKRRSTVTELAKQSAARRRAVVETAQRRAATVDELAERATELRTRLADELRTLLPASASPATGG